MRGSRTRFAPALDLPGLHSAALDAPVRCCCILTTPVEVGPRRYANRWCLSINLPLCEQASQSPAAASRCRCCRTKRPARSKSIRCRVIRGLAASAQPSNDRPTSFEESFEERYLSADGPSFSTRSPLRAADQRIENARENHSDKHKTHKSDKTHPLQNDPQAADSDAASLFGVIPGDSKVHKVQS